VQGVDGVVVAASKKSNSVAYVLPSRKMMCPVSISRIAEVSRR